MTIPSLATVEQAIGRELGRTRFSYGEHETSLYALGIGAPSDPQDPFELRFVYELSPDGFLVFPTFAVTFGGGLFKRLLQGEIAGIQYDPMMLVHGEQELELFRPLPRAASVLSSMRIADIQDKGSGMLMIFEVDSRAESGERLASARASVFMRGAGGYGGERGARVTLSMPSRAPDCVVREATSSKQALLYRLSGDANPLHIDPQVAAAAGFDKPILHGLCTFGFAARAILSRFGDGDKRVLRSMRARFAQPVYPGETLVTEMWETAPGELAFRTSVAERDVVVLNHARAWLD